VIEQMQGLTRKQRMAIEYLGYKYGNGGSCHTRQNHQFLHSFLAGKMDEAKQVAHLISEPLKEAIGRVLRNEYREFRGDQFKVLEAMESGMV
jgi:hypothetical protein